MANDASRIDGRLKSLVDSGVDYVLVNGKRRRLCSVRECDTYARGDGLCSRHRSDLRKKKRPSRKAPRASCSSIDSKTEELVINSNDQDSATVPVNPLTSDTSDEQGNFQFLFY